MSTLEDLHQQWTPHCEEVAGVAAWELRTIIHKIRGTYQENKDTFLQTRAISRTGISHEIREFMLESGASVHVRSKSDLPFVHASRETVPKSIESCTTISTNGKITTIEEATSKIWIVQLLEHSPAMLSLRFFFFLKNTSIPLIGGKTIAHINQGWTHYSLQVGNLCTDRRTIAETRPRSGSDAASGDRRQLRETESKIF